MSPAPPSETTWHMGCQHGDIAPTVILTALAEQAMELARLLDQPHRVAARREYLTLTGSFNEQPVSICSAGIGSPAVAIAVEEIRMVGGEILIWVGEIEPFELEEAQANPPEVVIPWAAVREEYTSRQYVPLAYPAVTDPGVAMALEKAALDAGLLNQVGVVLTTDTPGKSQGNFSPSKLDLEAYLKAGVLGREMSVSALFVTARLLGVRAGALLKVTEVNHVTGEMLMKNCLKALERIESEVTRFPGDSMGDKDEG